MNFEFTPCVLRPNAEAAPVYGLLIRPVSSAAGSTQAVSSTNQQQPVVVVQSAPTRSGGDATVTQSSSTHVQPILPNLPGGNKILLPSASRNNGYLSSAPGTSNQSVQKLNGRSPYVVTAPFTGGNLNQVDYSQKSGGGINGPVFLPASAVQDYHQHPNNRLVSESHLSESQAVQVVPQLSSNAQDYHHAEAPVYTQPQQQHMHNNGYRATAASNMEPMPGSSGSGDQVCFMSANTVNSEAHTSNSNNMSGSGQHNTSSNSENGNGEFPSISSSLLEDIEPSFTRDLGGLADFGDIGRILAESESILSPEYLVGAVSEASGQVIVSHGGESQSSYGPISNAPSQSAILDQHQSNHYANYNNPSMNSGYPVSSACPSSGVFSQNTVPLPTSATCGSQPVRHACRFQDDRTQHQRTGQNSSSSVELNVPRPQLEWERPQHEASSGTPDSGIQSIAGSPQGAGQSPMSPLMRSANNYHPANYIQQHGRPQQPVPGSVEPPCDASAKTSDVQKLPPTVPMRSKVGSSGRNAKKCKSKSSNQTKKPKVSKTAPVVSSAGSDFEDMPTLIAEAIGPVETIDTEAAPNLSESELTIATDSDKSSEIVKEEKEEKDDKSSTAALLASAFAASNNNALYNQLLLSLGPDQLQLLSKLLADKQLEQKPTAEATEQSASPKSPKKKSPRSASRSSLLNKKKKQVEPEQQDETFAGYVSDTSSSISTPSENRSASRASTSITATPLSSSTTLAQDFCADITKDPVLRDLSASQQRSRSVASSCSTQKGPHTVSLREKRMLMRLQEFRSRGRNILDPALIEHVLDLASKLQRITLTKQLVSTVSRRAFQMDWETIQLRKKEKEAELKQAGECEKDDLFDNLTNLEEEADSSDDEANSSGLVKSVPEIANTERKSPITRNATVEESENEQKFVEIKESWDGQKISLKIRLGPLQRTPSHTASTPPDSATEPQKRKICDSKTLPPKKRIKEQVALAESCQWNLPSPRLPVDMQGLKETETEISVKHHKKRRKSKKNPWDRVRLKKRQTPTETTKSALIRKCKNCKSWLRVQTSSDGDTNISKGNFDARLCSTCIQSVESSGHLHGPTNLKQCKVVLRKLPDRRRGFWRLKNVEEEDKNVTRPRKKYRRSGDFDESVDQKESWEYLILTKETFQPEEHSFQLPYDLWWDFYYFPKDPSTRFTTIRSNIYVDVPSRSSGQPSVCNCLPPSSPEIKGCEDNCLNRMMYAECQSGWCPCGEACTNQRFQKHQWKKRLKKIHTASDRGYGVRTDAPIKKDAFICEYVGEVVSTEKFSERMSTIYADSVHHYGLNLSSGYLIDSYRYGSIARFVNHSCNPCCEMQKWWVNGFYRIGLFALKDIEPGEELTYDYKFHSFRNSQKCLCGSSNCQGTIGSVSLERRNSNSVNVVKKPDIKKRVTLKERALVSGRRLFLLRNIRKVRRKTEESESGKETPTPEEAQKRQELDVKEFILALRTSRTVRTRRFASVTENEGLIRVAELAQVLHNLFSAVVNCTVQNGRKLLEDSEQFNEMKTQILSGFYKTPTEFDKSMTALLQSVRKVHGKEMWAVATEAFAKAKSDSIEQLRDVLKYELPASFVVADRKIKDVRNRKNGSNSSKTTTDLITTSTDLSYISKGGAVGSYDPDSVDGVWQKRADELYPDSDLVRCVCGIQEEEGTMLQCDKCLYWQHTDCVKASEEGEYVCYFCSNGCLRVPSVDVVQIPQPDIRLDGCTYYRSLVNNDTLQIRLGECVYVKRMDDETHKEILKQLEESCSTKKAKISKRGIPTEQSNRHCLRKDLRIFRVERLFTAPNGKKFVFGFYYARPHETFCEPTRRFYKNELFCTPMYNTLPLDAVAGRCLVLDSQTFSKGRPRIPCYQEMDIFVCDFRVDKNQRFFERVGPKNRYPVCMEPYVFRTFPEKRKIKRNFSPFVFPTDKRKSDVSLQKARAISESADEDIPLHQIKTRIMSRKRDEKRLKLERVITLINTRVH